jgi:NitT/TauT family transport system permease protein
LVLLGFGAWKLVDLLWDVSLGQWGETLLAALATLGRVLLSTALGTLWALPAGLAIGLSSRLSRLMQPVLQVLASFPAPMLFPVVVLILHATNVPLGAGSILLMLLGTQWYILFNVVAGAMAIPADLREMADSFRLGRWQRFWKLYVPAVFPYLVTGWVTAAGGAWNASIVSEYVVYQGKPEFTWGIGAQISRATGAGDFSLLAASTLVMAVMVVAFNRTVWRQLYTLAERRYSLSK